ncbi:THUMP domain-containing class I SAM-dependent RNA methyltransferase [Aerococcus kribbianus]|uniref:Class I SAM-dependent RNA methyltransferase n=1 Tax=Aerococcus kribbianus TaxID=2999064 RepID=A0A9X3FNS4_9LACT|nr:MULTISPECIES: class I SAM-dependent RNA methyltransferase [unclassified Aerococcus]MCZ0716938.1 class I SAM-dependent RNA methyltransferase [Aerococcus sp. YH-aer221]MCZ0725226.1 class I SAM-dependent RNA methyltransferase [Aerococcus sp. YH-aer222]
MTSYQLIATAAAGIEGLVGKELKAMGYDCQVENGRVRFQGELDDIAKCNLHLRTADHIKIVMAEFKAITFDQLYEGAKAIAWEDILPMDAEFPVTGKSVKSKLHSVPNCQKMVKKAAVDRLANVYHRRGRLPETGAKYPIEVSLHKDVALITLDTTGSSLFKRGYRTEKGGAPLKENMAAAIMKLTTWFPDKPLVDPTCGSGTLLIEAAMMGMNMAPGLNRHFVSEDWDIFQKAEFDHAREEARAQIDHDIQLDILGTDIDHRMITIAQANAQAAGVGQQISFKQMQVADFTTDKSFGIIVSNPPYGERLNDQDYVHNLYREMGQVFSPLNTWSKYILTSDLDFENYYGEKATKKRKLYNGSLRTDLFQYWGDRK